MKIKANHYYWVRYKYGNSITVGIPYRVINGKADGWSLPFMQRITVEKDREITVIQEIPFPQSIFPKESNEDK